MAKYRRIGATGFVASNDSAAAQRQFDFLIGQGMEPHHTLLDVGCGPLRAGLGYIEYLDVGNYYGIEKEATLIRAAREIELPRTKLTKKDPHLYVIDDFDISDIGTYFDYMIAYSVFNHLRKEYIELAIRNLTPWLKEDGAFFADFRESDSYHWDVDHPKRRDEVQRSYYPVSFFEDLAKKHACKIEVVGRWDERPIRTILKFTR